MKKLLLVLICFVAPLHLGADGQTRPWKVAYDFCFPVAGDNGYETHCEIRMAGEGTDLRLTPGVRPVWSRDGLKVGFAAGDIYVFSLADSTVVNLTNAYPLFLHDSPQWSPDNRRIAFATRADGAAAAEIAVMNADGSARTHLIQNLAGPFAWSPDGTAIAFAGTADGMEELFIVGADGSNPTRLTYNVGFNDVSERRPEAMPPSWSPDGMRIAFDCAHDVCTVNADGSNLTKLTTDAAFSFGAQFSPVDGRIAFATSRFGGIEVAIMAADGTVTRVAPGMRAWQQAWAPAGERLAFSHFPETDFAVPADGSYVPNGQVYTVKADGTDHQPLASGQNPQWAPFLPGQPAATFTSVCTGASCQFDATASFDAGGSIVSYLWKFGDGTTSTDAAPAHTYAIGADYYVTLIVTDDAGSTDTAFQNVRANTPPVASFTVVCNGPTCTFDGSGSTDQDGPIAYTWYFGDGASEQGPLTTSHTYRSGTFTAALAVLDRGGAESWAQQTVTVVNAVPVASFTVACSNLTCTFDASGSSDPDGTIRTYFWGFDNGAVGSGRQATYTHNASGTYTATLTVQDDVGQLATASQPVTVTRPTEYMHIGDMFRSVNTRPRTWDAFATIQVHSENHAFINDVVVTGSWNDGTTASCTTGGSGMCTFSKYNLPRNTTSVTFTVTSATHATLVYKPASNHDPGGDSNGTVITISRQ